LPFLSVADLVVAVLVCGHFGCTPSQHVYGGDLHVIGCCNNQARTSSAQWPAPPHEVCESYHYRSCTSHSFPRSRRCYQ